MLWRYALSVMAALFHPGSIRKLVALLAVLLILPLLTWPASGVGAVAAQDKSSSTKKNSAAKESAAKQSSSTRKKSPPKKKRSSARRRPPRKTASQSSSQRSRPRNASASPTRRRRPRPKRQPLKVVAPQEWRALARDISAASNALGRDTRRAADRLAGLAPAPRKEEVRRYRNAGDERRIARLLLQLEYEPGDIETLRLLVDIERRNHRYDATLRYLLQALALQPLDQNLHMDLGRNYRRHGRYAQALAAFQEVVYLNSGHPEARLAQANIMDLQGDTEASAAVLDEVQLQQGRTAQYFYYQTVHLSAAGDHRIAIQTATSGIGSYPDESRLYHARGAAFALLGMTGKAKVDYYDALALDGDNLEALRLLGGLSEQERHIDVAIRAYGQVLEQEPGDAGASLGLARSLLRDLQLPAAIEELTTLTALHGQSPEANQLLAQGYYLSALQASRQRDFHRALEFQAASSKRAETHSAGWTVTALLWAGEAEWSHGRERYAANYYQLAVDMNPFSAQAHMGLSLAYAAIGESARAGWHVQEAERLGWQPRRPYARYGNPVP